MLKQSIKSIDIKTFSLKPGTSAVLVSDISSGETRKMISTINVKRDTQGLYSLDYSNSKFTEAEARTEIDCQGGEFIISDSPYHEDDLLRFYPAPRVWNIENHYYGTLIRTENDDVKEIFNFQPDNGRVVILERTNSFENMFKAIRELGITHFIGKNKKAV